MKRLASISFCSALAVALVSNTGRAQVDVNPPLPNVLLLVDTSGSMEYKSSGAEYPSCVPEGTSEKSRWVELLEVLTGSIQNYSCQAVDRSSSDFVTEYSLSGNRPYDYGYINPYHRPLSGACTPGPGVLPLNAFEFPAGAIGYHRHDSLATSCTTFAQSANGLLDTFSNLLRFGLMTFDTLPDAGRGYSGTGADHASGIAGTWSYYVGNEQRGRPAACEADVSWEVGARNAAAPPWEGRMVAFGPPTAGLSELQTKNSQIQQILLGTRPYGATPIAGMLKDARDFLRNDGSPDPLNPAQSFGPKDDPYVQGGCRKSHIILLSDGEPNTDLRPHCEGLGPPAGECPYDKPEQIAYDLRWGADLSHRTDVYVIGFAVSEVTLSGNPTPVDCKNMSDHDLTSPDGLCAQNADERQLQACCVLNRIAYNGGTERARFADDMTQLRVALNGIFADLSESTTSRTLPVSASATTVASPGFANSFRFYSSFDPDQFSVWKGKLERQRFVCTESNDTLEPVPQAIDTNKGDDFAVNLNSGQGPPRLFYSVTPDLVGSERRSGRSIRPHIEADRDGLGTYGGQQYSGAAEAFVSASTAAALQLGPNHGSECVGLTADQCKTRILRWLVGLDNGTDYHRCRTPGNPDCQLLGGIYHSTPRVVGAPGEALRDESYELFAAQRQRRPVVLYTSTTDGLFHGFKVASNDPEDSVKVDRKANNELWAFIPPAVLPKLDELYPGSPARLLDGVPVVRDVVSVQVNGKHRFERSLANARADSASWRTVLVQSFGSAHDMGVDASGYFAIDVTDPEPSGSDPDKGPRFLWQLTTDQNGVPLFGRSGATPIITTLFLQDENDGSAEKEIAVAILPGGSAGAPTGAACARADTSPANVDPAFTPRSQVNCYDPNFVAGRSLTIVRLDTGEIVRTFRRDDAELPAALRPRVIEAPLDSPITGQPAAYPGATGAVADRLFVGDADGALWRVDLSAVDPDKWTMSLFVDAYASQAFDAGQPIDTQPVVSATALGNVTVAFSTGDQEVFTANDVNNYVFSLEEKLNADHSAYTSSVRWFERLRDGERVAGPISLFNGVLYFATFQPEPADSPDVCQAGSSRLWWLHYYNQKTSGQPQAGGLGVPPPALASANDGKFIDASALLNEPGATIFGVSVQQLPSCVEQPPEPSTDGFFGGGAHRRFDAMSPARFQLVMHTGSAGSPVSGGGTNVLSVDLPTPVASPRIDSWGAIIE